jgi:hypothetical protein
MAAALQGHQVHPEGRAWKKHFPAGDLWVFGYGYVDIPSSFLKLDFYFYFVCLCLCVFYYTKCKAMQLPREKQSTNGESYTYTAGYPKDLLYSDPRRDIQVSE